MDRTTLILVLAGLGLVGYWAYTLAKGNGVAGADGEGATQPEPDGTQENPYPVPYPVRPEPVGYDPGYQNPGGGLPGFGLGAWDPCVLMPHLCSGLVRPLPIYQANGLIRPDLG